LRAAAVALNASSASASVRGSRQCRGRIGVPYSYGSRGNALVVGQIGVD
jgi:hypothetical protein